MCSEVKLFIYLSQMQKGPYISNTHTHIQTLKHTQLKETSLNQS